VSDSDAISPTAHYTGQVWLRNGLSHPRLGTPQGQVLYDALHPMMVVSGMVGGPSLETYLLARHRAIDALLQRAIEEHGVSQVIEVAAGLSPRGWRFSQRYGDRITYIEADLPDMAARKRRALAQMLSLHDHHRVVDLDALRDAGPGSLAELAASLDRAQGLAIITEGLLGYLDPDSVDGLWRRFARTLHEFRTGRYVSDLHLGSVQDVAVRGFRVVLSAFVRGRVYLHFHDAAEGEAALREAGFDDAAVSPAYAVISDGSSPQAGGADRGTRLAHILEASTR
jgi:O-methyltransferase involved in polyketide biosynthesis